MGRMEAASRRMGGKGRKAGARRFDFSAIVTNFNIYVTAVRLNMVNLAAVNSNMAKKRHATFFFRLGDLVRNSKT